MSEVTEQAPITTSAEADVKTEAPKVEAQAPAVVVDPAKATEPAAAPVVYDLKLPKDSKLGAEYVNEVTSFAKERGLNPEQAQALLDREVTAKAADAEAQQTQVKQLNDVTWRSELQADKEIGGDNFEKSGQLAFKGAEYLFGNDGVQKLMESNLNHHPLLFRGLVKLGKLMDNDQLVSSKNETRPEEKSLAELFYGNQSKE